MNYQFRPWQELAWGVLVATVVAVLQVLVTLEPGAVVDWRAWLVALVAGAVRAAAGAALALLTMPPAANGNGRGDQP